MFCIISLKPLSSSKHPYKAFSIVYLFSSSLLVWFFFGCRSLYTCLHPILRAMNRVGEKLQLVPVIHDRGDGLKLCDTTIFIFDMFVLVHSSYLCHFSSSWCSHSFMVSIVIFVCFMSSWLSLTITTRVMP